MKEQLEKWIEREADTYGGLYADTFSEGAHLLLPHLIKAVEALEYYADPNTHAFIVKNFYRPDFDTNDVELIKDFKNESGFSGDIKVNGKKARVALAEIKAGLGVE
jgi:hypothetical protein